MSFDSVQDDIDSAQVKNGFYPIMAKVENALGTTTQKAKDGFRISPNRATDYLHFEGIKVTVPGNIYTVLGIKVRDFSANKASTVYVGDLAKGVYFVGVDGNVMKVVKK